jgi:hypothetical protein
MYSMTLEGEFHTAEEDESLECNISKRTVITTESSITTRNASRIAILRDLQGSRFRMNVLEKFPNWFPIDCFAPSPFALFAIAPITRSW